MSQFAPRLPRCADCKGGAPHVVSLGDGRTIWLCGSCEVKRRNPDAPRAVPPPRERRAKPLQKEHLF